MIEFNKQYANYKKLCEALEVEPKSSGYKQQHIRELQKQYEMKITRKENITIIREYTQLEKAQTTNYASNKKYLTSLMFTLLSNAENNVLELDMKQLLLSLAIVNNNFFIAKHNTIKADLIIAQDNGGYLKEFINSSDIMLRRIVKEILEDMEDKALLKVDEIPTFAERYKGTDGNWYTSTHLIDDEKEFPIFLEAKRLALQSIGESRMSDLTFFQHIEVKHKIEDYLKEKLGVDWFYYTYRIRLNKVGIKSLLVENLGEFKLAYNEQVQSKLLKSKNKDLLLIDDEAKKLYVNSLINVKSKLDLKAELKQFESEDNEE